MLAAEDDAEIAGLYELWEAEGQLEATGEIATLIENNDTQDMCDDTQQLTQDICDDTQPLE